MKRLIITADDYGMSHAVNTAIEEGIAAGIITSTNVMMNMPFCKDAVKLKETKVSIGLHWNLTCGKPLLKKEEIPTIVAQNGEFYSYSEFRRRYRKRLISDSDIQKELVAQYKKYKKIIGEPEYWNTHENVHVDFKIYKVCVNVALKLRMSKMRSHQRIYVAPKNGKGSYSFVWVVMEPLKAKLLDIWQKNANKLGISSPDGRICCLDDEDSHDVEYVFHHIKWNSREIGELTIHPAICCDSEYFGEMKENRLIEYGISTDPRVLDIAKEADIQLVSFVQV